MISHSPIEHTFGRHSLSCAMSRHYWFHYFLISDMLKAFFLWTKEKYLKNSEQTSQKIAETATRDKKQQKINRLESMSLFKTLRERVNWVRVNNFQFFDSCFSRSFSAAANDRSPHVNACARQYKKLLYLVNEPLSLVKINFCRVIVL